MEQVSFGAANVAQEAEQEQVQVADGNQELARCGRAAVAHRGMVSAEWAVGIVAAIAIAGVLVGVVTSGTMEETLLNVILKVIGTFTEVLELVK